MLRATGITLFRTYMRGQVILEEPLPRRGPIIIAANHSSILDGIIVHLGSWRPLRIFLAEEWARWWPVRPLFVTMGVIPVKRDHRNFGAIDLAVEALGRGEAIAIFPEGGLQESGELGPFRSGAARIALRSGAPVYPLAIIGAFDAMPWPKVFPRPRRGALRFGAPLRFPRVDGGALPPDLLLSTTARIRESVQRLLAQGLP